MMKRIEKALDAATRILLEHAPNPGPVAYKRADDPVTEADRAVDAAVRGILLREGEGWLSEETVDDRTRLDKRRVWIVDPLDGTKEFIQGLPEWAVSIGLVEDHAVLAGGVANPATSERFTGVRGGPVLRNGEPVTASCREALCGATVLASRTELRKGQWDGLQHLGMNIVPKGSIAYKLALLAAGCADLVISLAPKNEWDIAAGVLLAEVAGAQVLGLDGRPLRFNQRETLLDGLVAGPPKLVARALEAVAAATR